MLRLFISINCDEKTKERLIAVQEKIKAQSEKGNFSRPENLHLTLVFLGETPEDRVPLISESINEALSSCPPSFTLAFTKTGFFRHSNKNLWLIGAMPNEPSLSILYDIRTRITNGLSLKNINFDSRQFNPHITLGREIKHSNPIIIPEQKIVYPVNRISLMKSERISGVLTYSEMYGQDLCEQKTVT